jgi:hypothetical protein
MKEINAQEQQKQFVLAGNATFTVQNTNTGTRYTFKVCKAKDQDPAANNARTLHFVKLLTGSDNENDYIYIGTIFNGQEFRRTRTSKVTEDAPGFKAFAGVWGCLSGKGLPEAIKFYHEGKCCRCGRTLTVPESIEAGIGPECAGKI